MKLDANVSMGAVARAMGIRQLETALIRQVRVTVAFRTDGQDCIETFSRLGGDRLLVQHAEVDREEVIEKLTDDGHLIDDDDYEAFAPRDLHDFIDACASGDRCTALALVPRLFQGRAALAAEQLLLDARAPRARQAAHG